jgi:hypothetical protein
MKKTALFLIAIGLIATFTFCNKDDDDNKPGDPLGQYSKLYNKWWYNLGESRGDHYFHPTDSTTGWFEVDHPFMPDYTGTYQWYPSGDSMFVDINGTPLSYSFKDISDHTMSYAPSNEPLNVYHFQDTKP